MSGYLEMFKLSKIYDTPSGPLPVVESFDLEVAKGEFVALIGHSGCGKSTVLQMVAGLSEISEGHVVLDAREIDGPGPDRGVVFQAPCLLPWMTAWENVMLGVRRVYPHVDEKTRREIVEYHLSLVGLAGRDGQATGGALGRHAPAGWTRARLRLVAQDAAARRALRHARFADPPRAAGESCSTSGPRIR